MGRLEGKMALNPQGNARFSSGDTSLTQGCSEKHDLPWADGLRPFAFRNIFIGAAHATIAARRAPRLPLFHES
jgi:hypothetical protein